MTKRNETQPHTTDRQIAEGTTRIHSPNYGVAQCVSWGVWFLQKTSNGGQYRAHKEVERGLGRPRHCRALPTTGTLLLLAEATTEVVGVGVLEQTLTLRYDPRTVVPRALHPVHVALNVVVRVRALENEGETDNRLKGTRTFVVCAVKATMPSNHTGA